MTYERVGQLWRVKPGCADEYRRRHRAIWPELESALRRAGVRSYTIYLHDELVFSHMEVVSYAAMVEQLASDPVALRWEDRFADILEYPDADPRTGWPQCAVEVWTLTA
jgi:L-rhamnose mutarotase